MATTAATKPAPAAAPAIPTPMREQKLRKAQIRRFGSDALMPLGKNYEDLEIQVPSDWNFADVLNPTAWSALANKVAPSDMTGFKGRLGSTVHVYHPKFYAILRIQEATLNAMKMPDGLTFMCIGPQIDLKTNKMCPLDLETGLPWVDPAPAKED
jgi:hypothetical protein